MKKHVFLLFSLGAACIMHAQNVGIGINSPIAALDVAGTGGYGTAAFRGTTNISHFNYGEDEDTYIRAGKDNGVVVLNDIPGGTVGIGTIDAGFPLSFAPLLGDKISLFGNSGSHYGLGIQSYLMQIYTDALDADIAFGYGSSSSFTERMRIINSGELGMQLNGRIELKNGTIPLNNNYGPGIWLYNSDNSGVLGFMGTQNNQNLGFFGGPDGWGLTYDAINSRVGIRTSTPAASLEVNGYTKLGSNAPSIKVKKLTWTTAATEGNYVNIASGVTSSKILSVSVMVSYDTDIWIGPYYGVAGYNFRWVVAVDGSISVENYFGDSANILSKPIKILITYEE